jgi:putative heme iron utilization protein
MSDENKKDVRQETTPAAVQQAKTLIRTARSAALATIEPGTGWPLATRVGMSTDMDGTPIILISKLAAHTPALLADPRCTLLVGYPGRGDPLAHPRISIACEARQVERDSDEHTRLDHRYLCHQQKAQLYSGLGDFRYFRLEVRHAALNGGFGKAFDLTGADLINANPANAELAAAEAGAIEHMNDDHGEAVGMYAEYFAKAPAGNWRLVGIDAEGIDIIDGDDVRRVWFETELTSPHDMHMTLVRMAGEARRGLDRPLRDARVTH